MDAPWLSAKLSGVKPESASGWTSALCPAHADSEPSFGFKIGPDGQVAAINCFAGCSPRAIAEALGVTVNDFRPHPIKQSKSIQAVYDYHDEQGVLLYQVVRRADKALRFRHPDPTKKGGWVWDAQGIRRVLYKLPELKGHPRLYVSEGEKDVDACRLLDLPATTNPSGAGGWTADFTAQLVATGVKEVVVLVDNDPAGDARGWHVARACLEVGLEVKRVLLPGLPEKGDISDWIEEQGHSRQDLDQVVHASPWLTLADCPPETAQDRIAADLDPRLIEPLRALGGLSEYPDANLLFGPLDAMAAVLVTMTDQTKKALATQLVYVRMRAKKITDGESKLLLKAALSKAAGTVPGNGQTVTFTDPEPADEPVDGPALLDEMVALITRFVVTAQEATHAMALWVMFTWTFECFGIAPYLTLQSPLKRCGKTRVMILLKWLSRRSLLISNTSPAPIYRLVAEHQPTMLFDEVDTFFELHDELQNILNAGHNRDSAYVLRSGTSEEGHQPQTFSVFAPKALALIGAALPGTILDRSIVVPMRRKAKAEVRERLGQRSYRKLKPVIDPLLRRARRWAQDHAALLQEAEPELPETLNDREQDNWEALLAIADAVGGKWPGRARHAARRLSGAADEADDTPGFKLLGDIQTVFLSKAGEMFFPTGLLLSRLRDLAESPWATYGKRGDPLGAEQLAKLLRPFKVHSRGVRQGQGFVRGYTYKDLEPVFALYLPEGPSGTEPEGLTSNPISPIRPQDSTDLRPVSDSITGPPISGSKGDVTHGHNRPVSGLSGSTGVNGGVPKDTPRRTPVHAPETPA
jgi:uncharacterized protein DUF3631